MLLFDYPLAISKVSFGYTNNIFAQLGNTIKYIDTNRLKNNNVLKHLSDY